ncbi:MAG: twin-arginine translocation signal domain-containing protein [Chloroflexota bacterium]
MSQHRKALSRRQFLRLSSATAATLALAACVAPGAAPAPEAASDAASDVQLMDIPRDQMTTNMTPMEDAGTFHQMIWGGDVSPSYMADMESWFATYYPNMTYEVSFAPWGDYWTKLPILLASGDHPDSAYTHFTRTAVFADKDWMTPIDDFIEVLPPPDWPDDYHWSAVDNMAYDGVQYGLPIDWAPRAMLVNRDIMEPIIGEWPPPDDWSWLDVLQYAIQATKEVDGGKQFGLGLAHWPIRQWNLVKAWGGRFFNDDISAGQFLDAETIECFQWTYDAKHVHQVTPSSADQQVFGGDFGGFTSGTIAMWATLSDEARPALEAVGDKFTMGIAPEPVGPDGVSRFGFEGNVGWFVPKESKWPAISYELMRWRLTDDDQARFMATSGFGGFPGRKSSGKWNVQQIEESLPNYGHAAWEIGQENEAHFPLFPEGLEWDALYTKWMDPVLSEGDPGVEAALEGLQADTDKLLAGEA